MTKPKLTVITGGLSSEIKDRPKHFVSAYVTDTRLMGVLAVYARWYITPLPEEFSDGFNGDLHQFFYIDCEEAGLETYTSHRGGSMTEVEKTEQALTGGLGARKKEIDERLLRGLLCKYYRFNLKHGLNLPKGRDEYGFVLEPETVLNQQEEKILMETVCDDIVSDFQLVNYFLMRAFGRDYEGARFLTSINEESGPLTDDFPLDIYGHYVKATFCRNVIDIEKKYGDGASSYLCESLVEMNGEYDTLISKVVVRNLKVIGFEHCSGFHISSTEAAMILAKPEYCTVFEVMLSEEEVENNIGEFTMGLRTIMSTHSNGRMFMSFKSSNDHVNSPVFMLSNDINGVYFLTDYGQLIAAAYSLSDIKRLEATLASSPLSPYLFVTAKYEFKEPVLFEFTRSGFEDFEDFLDFLRGD